MGIETNVSEELHAFLLDKKLTPKEEKYIAKIDTVIQKLKDQESAILKELKNNKISKSRITREIGISRQTLYNYPILNEYIELIIKEEEKSSPEKELVLLRDELNEKQVVINKMINRDAQIIALQEENKILKKEIEALRKGIESEQSRFEAFRRNIGK